MSKPLFFICLLFSIVVCNVSAVPLIGQGDTVYRGETVDISLAASWPDYAVAWCSSEGNYCTPPDQIIKITGNMHQFYIDDRFNYGTYYRWSGEWSRGENLLAFVVKKGNRTDYSPINITENKTVLVGNISRVVNSDDTTIVITRGDSGLFTYQNESVFGDGHMWLFGGDEYVNGGTHMELNQTIQRDNDSYYFEFKKEFTNDLDYGNYTGYIQANGRNGFQDIGYIKNYKTPFNATYPILDSIYKAVPMQSINGFLPKMIESKFITMATDKVYSDDIIVPITMQVMRPEITIRDYYEDNDTVYIGGVTTLNENCTITAIIDPDHYALAKDIRANTYTATVEGNIHSLRTFTIKMDVAWDELSVGDHEIHFTGDGYKNNLKAEQTLIFKVSDIYVMPTPTPARERVIVEDYGWHRITPTPVVTTSVVTAVPTKINLGNVSYDGNKTTATPTRTKALTDTAKPTPTKTLVVPLNPIMGILALGVAMIVLRRN